MTFAAPGMLLMTFAAPGMLLMTFAAPRVPLMTFAAPRVLLMGLAAPRGLLARAIAPGMLLTSAAPGTFAGTFFAITAPRLFSARLSPFGPAPPVTVVALMAAPAVVAPLVLGTCRDRPEGPEAPDGHDTGQDHHSPNASHSVDSLDSEKTGTRRSPTVHRRHSRFVRNRPARNRM
jgi:hypothetical protein